MFYVDSFGIRVDFGEVSLFTSVAPKFKTVHYVLPKHITAGTEGSHRIQIDRSDPYCHGGILLSHALAAFYVITRFFADSPTNGEEQQAEKQGGSGNINEYGDSSSRLYDVSHGNAARYGERKSPKIEG